ncbi:hypothetical protein [Marivita hallyeonensis]|uniref:Lipoprotein n=1 Tax=Marivita hallyeonensis TaxID=996342 RepID=A0A1M5RHV1_9RHOB|nr:hypothetical protein [Marivita hallyeonensis]SHH25932.1 hypothetical protein SAMN05443551_1770 [Marivita hallyeonensis]
MKSAWISGALLLALVACGRGELDTVVYEGARFTGDLRSERGDRAAFVASGGPASVSIEGAKQAAEFQVVQHCIRYLGSSDVAWTNGPDVEDAALTIDNNKVVLSGRCIEP